MRPATALRSADWTAFDGPGRAWERRLETFEVEAERRVVAAVRETPGGERDDDWAVFLRDHMPATALAFSASSRALRAAADRCTAWPVARHLELAAGLQRRQAEAIVLYAADAEARFGEMSMSRAVELWRTHDAWRPVHDLLVAAAREPDWGRAVVVVGLHFEPLVGRMLRNDFGIEAARAHGDAMTEVVAQTTAERWELSREWTGALTRFLLDDEHFGEHNRRVLAEWVAELAPDAHAACRAIAGIGATLPGGRGADVLVPRAMAEQDRLLGRMGLAGVLHATG